MLCGVLRCEMADAASFLSPPYSAQGSESNPTTLLQDRLERKVILSRFAITTDKSFSRTLGRVRVVVGALTKHKMALKLENVRFQQIP